MTRNNRTFPDILRRAGAALLSLALLAAPALPVRAEAAVSAGAATAQDAMTTVTIRSQADFLAFAANCSYDYWSRDKFVVFEADISLSGVDYRPAASFGGLLDGRGHTVSGLKITESIAPAGLFSEILPGGSVRSLNVEAVITPGGNGEQVGGIVGVNRGTVSGCTFTGTVHGEKKSGGICGENLEGGVLRFCQVQGGVFGTSMTGGIVGSNSGTVSGCVNRAYVNTNMVDPALPLTELGTDIVEILRRVTSPDTYNIATDSGGVAGYNDALLTQNRNYGSIGYQHLGYNVGGIAGRSRGFVTECVNDGQLNGRRSVGGVTGLLEPYMVLHMSESGLDKVRGELQELNDTVNQATYDASGVSNSVTERLQAVGDSVEAAEDRAQELTDGIGAYGDSVVDTVNDTISEVNRGSETLDESLLLLTDTTDGLRRATDTMTGALEDLEAGAQDFSDSGALGDVEDATRDFSDAAYAADRMADNLRDFANNLQDGADEIGQGVGTLRGTIGPAEGVSQAEWNRLIHGYTDEDGNRVPGALDDISEGSRDIFSGISEVADALDLLYAGLQDGSIPLDGVVDFLNQRDISGSLSKASDGMRRMSGGVDTVYKNTRFNDDAAQRGMAQIQEGMQRMSRGSLDLGGGVFSSLESGLNHLADAVSGAETLTEGAQRGLGGLRDASRQLSDALGSAQGVLDYLNRQGKLNLPPAEYPDAYISTGDFYDSLHDISNQLSLLNGEAQGNSDLIVFDMQRINDQFSAVMDSMMGVLDDVGNTDGTRMYQDTSDEDIDAVLHSKVYRCVNRGTVDGDIGVGGVAGAMAVFNELNPEGEDSFTLSELLHRTYYLKCILQESVNRGVVTGRRSNVGGLCGNEELGVIFGCESYGEVLGEQARNIGGVAGYGNSVIRACWAKCDLTGGEHVGGIVGATKERDPGLLVENCRSVVSVSAGSHYTGAISGTSGGTYTGNRFVSDTLAGVNRSSAAGQADPVSYELMCQDPQLPADFRTFTLRFVADGEVVSSRSFQYGDSFDSSVFPVPPSRDGQYAVWDRDDLTNLRLDTTVHAIYATSVRALPGTADRSTLHPVFFVEGDYSDWDTFQTYSTTAEFTPGTDTLFSRLRSFRRTMLEQWELTFPHETGEDHLVRYLPPQTAAGELELYYQKDGAWVLAKTEKIGSYLQFTLPPDRVACLTVVDTATPWWVWAIVAVFLVNAAALLVVFLLFRPLKNPVTDEDKARAAARKRHRVRCLTALGAGLVLLGFVIGGMLLFSPAISRLELYNMLHNYITSDELDMSMRMTLANAQGEEDRDYELGMDVFVTEREGKRISCVSREGIRLFRCGDTLLLENGQTYQARDAFPDYAGVVDTVAKLFRSGRAEYAEDYGMEVYRLSLDEATGKSLFSALLAGYSQMDGALSGPLTATVELDVSDGRPLALDLEWTGGVTASAIVLFTSEERDHSVPQPVRSALTTGLYKSAPVLTPEVQQLIWGWFELTGRIPVNADVRVQADCGPLLLDQEMSWKMISIYSQAISRLERKGSTLYFTGDTACTETGQSVDREDDAIFDAPGVLYAALDELLLGTPETERSGDRLRFTINLESMAMDALVRRVAPQTEGMDLSLTDGRVSLEMTGSKITRVAVDCGGTVRVARSDVPAAVSAVFDFSEGGDFGQLSDSAADALFPGAGEKTVYMGGETFPG